MSIATLCLTLLAAPADEEALWLRQVSISPDGQHVAFSYAGDLWIAPAKTSGDGPVEAELLTTHVGFETSPVWAPDSNTIAFAADWHGQMDVFVTTLDRAPAERLTFHSAGDRPVAFSPDGSEIWFVSSRQDAVQAILGSAVLSELYAIDTDGGAPRQLLTTPAERAAPSADGKTVLYQDKKAYEDEWRKHQVSSHARDLWKWEPETGEHTQPTRFRGEDRDPVWLGADRIAFLSERNGTFNVFVGSLDAPEDAQQVTQHEIHPVRFLSAADDGTMAYAFDGEIYTLAPSGSPKKLPVVARVDQRTNRIERETKRDGVTEMAVSPDEEEVAFVVRGEVFVASIEHGTTKRITTTPEQERSVTWAKDGRTLYYASERDNSWNLYSSTIRREQEETFSGATLLDEQPVLVDEHETFQPLVSPDGKSMAFLVDREAIHVMDLETKEHREVVSDEWNYSYSDGDISFRWSPDSNWLTFSYSPYERFSGEIGIVNLESGDITNVSSSGYDEGAPRFSPDGKAVVFASSRFGQLEHSGRGGQADVLAVYLTQEAYDDAELSWEDLERVRERRKKDEEEEEKEKKKEEDEAGEEESSDEGEESDESEGDDAKDDDDEEEEPAEPIDVELRRIDERRRRLTMQSAPTGDVLVTPNGEAVIYVAEVDGKWDLWTSHVRDRKTQRLLALGDQGPGAQLHLSDDGKTLIVRTARGQLKKAKIGGGKHDLPESAKPEGIAFAAEMTIDGPAEREHIFEHAWRQTREKFYRADLHGVDWEAMKVAYARFLPHVTNGYDFAELLSEMLGELNASHTGGRYRPSGMDRDDTASLGMIYGDLNDQGLLIEEIVVDGAADSAESKLAAGVRITAIDGEDLDPSENPWRLLDRKSSKPVLLSCVAPDGSTFDEVIKPMPSGAERELMYRRWIETCENLVSELSGGRVGYVHVRGMNDSSYREVYEQVLGRCSDKEALIVDTRWNGGGWLHDQLVTFLGGEQYCTMVPRDKEPGRFGGEPLSRWSRPVCVVQNEGNYSDAHFFPYAFRTLGLGKLIGAPVAGTTTAVWWERCFDGQTIFGIPQLGVFDTDGNYLENQELFPDIEVYNDPESVADGRDRQLEVAVRAMLDEVDGAQPVEAASETQGQ